MSERSGIEIDYCPQCRGVWLDRGELDKIIERNNAGVSPEAQAPPAQWSQPEPPRHNQGYGQSYGHGHKPYKKRKSFLEELFD